MSQSGSLLGALRAIALHVFSISLSMTQQAKRLIGHVLRVFCINGVVNRSVSMNIAYIGVNR